MSGRLAVAVTHTVNGMADSNPTPLLGLRGLLRRSIILGSSGIMSPKTAANVPAGTQRRAWLLRRVGNIANPDGRTSPPRVAATAWRIRNISSTEYAPRARGYYWGVDPPVI